MRYPFSNLWSDRRVKSEPFDGPDRRVDDRRRLAADIEDNRRGPTWLTKIIRSSKSHAVLLCTGDFIALATAYLFVHFFIGHPARFGLKLPLESVGLVMSREVLFAFWACVVVGGFWVYGHYTRRRAFWDELHEMVKLMLAVACLDVVVSLIANWEISRLRMIATWSVILVALPLMRVAVKHYLIYKGVWMRPTVIIGVGRNAKSTATALLAEQLLGFNVVMFMRPPASWALANENTNEEHATRINVSGRSIPVYDWGDDFADVIDRLGYPHVVVALDSGELREVTKLMYLAGLPDTNLNIVPSINGLPLIGMEMMHFFKQDIIMLRVKNNLARRVPQMLKRMFDICVASLLLIGLLPLFLVVIPYIRSSTGASALFGHERVGRNGVKFKCFKFRTMVANADEVLAQLLKTDPEARAQWEKDFKLKNDPRITRLGGFLRRTSLDELAQLWNVMRGEMSLIGPRPIIDCELEKYAENVGYYLEARPGMTGLWQISGRNNVSYEERIYLDVWYVKNWTLWYDVVILMKTFRVVFGDKAAY